VVVNSTKGPKDLRISVMAMEPHFIRAHKEIDDYTTKLLLAEK
jgi:hypothetical protein